MLRASLVLLAAHAVGADTYNVVVNGVMNEPLTVIGDAWAAGSDGFGGYITRGGTNNYLRWEHDLGTGDFTSTMNLVVTDLYNSGASFEFNYNSAWGSNFGFAGYGSLDVFTDGPFFGDGPSYHGNLASYGIIDGELMTLVVQRRGDDYTISVTTAAMGEKVVHTQTKAGDIQGLGLRPWRSTIRLYEWTVVEEETALTNEKLRDWVKRWCWPTAGHGDRKGLPDISTWNTSQVTDMSGLFGVAKGWMRGRPEFSSCVLPDSASSFNDDISAWDTSSVTRMDSMFLNQSSFNQSLSNWQVDKVTTMSWMFYRAEAFDQDLGWCVDDDGDLNNAFKYTPCESTSCGVEEKEDASECPASLATCNALGSDGAKARSVAFGLLLVALLGAAL